MRRRSVPTFILERIVSSWVWIHAWTQINAYFTTWTRQWIRQISAASCDQVVTWKSCSDDGSSKQLAAMFRDTEQKFVCCPFSTTVPHHNPFLQGRRCVLKDCCKILDNTVLPPETVVPPFTVFSGCPGRLQPDTCMPWLMPFFAYVAFPFSFFRPVFWWASRVHAGLDDWCNQELLSKVPASQSDLRPALKPPPAPTTGLSVSELSPSVLFFSAPEKLLSDKSNRLHGPFLCLCSTKLQLKKAPY